MSCADSVLPPQAENEEEQAREIFQALDGHLREELPQLIDLRVPYLEPSFECMVRSLSPSLFLLLRHSS